MSSIQVFFVFAMYYVLKLFLFATLKKYNNSFVQQPRAFHNHCFQFVLGLRIVPRETENNGYAKRRKRGGGQKDFYGIFQSGGWTFFEICI